MGFFNTGRVRRKFLPYTLNTYFIPILSDSALLFYFFINKSTNRWRLVRILPRHSSLNVLYFLRNRSPPPEITPSLSRLFSHGLNYATKVRDLVNSEFYKNNLKNSFKLWTLTLPNGIQIFSLAKLRTRDLWVHHSGKILFGIPSVL